MPNGLGSFWSTSRFANVLSQFAYVLYIHSLTKNKIFFWVTRVTRAFRVSKVTVVPKVTWVACLTRVSWVTRTNRVSRANWVSWVTWGLSLY